MTFTGSVDSAVGGMVLAAADHLTLADYAPVTLKDSTGASATVEILTAFRAGMADSVTLWRNSPPYGITAIASRPDKLYVADTGMNALYEVTISTGRYRVVTHFAPFPNTTPGPPVSSIVKITGQ